MDQKPSTSQPSKTKDTRSNRRREGGEFGGLEINDAVVEKLMKDPVKRQLILNIVASENKKIDAYKKTLKEKLQVTPTSSPKRNFESPTALYRRRVLQRRKSEQSSDISENGSIEPAYIQSPVCVDKLLKGVIAFVEVKSGTLDRSEPVKACVRSLGGVVKETFTRDVTHVIFKDGPYSTCQKARLLNVHLVSVLWLEACKISCTRISEKKFPALGTFDHNASTICTKMQNEYQDVLQEEIEQIKEKGSPLDHIQTVADKRKSLIKPAKFTIDPVPSSSADDDDDDSDDDTYIDGQMVNRRKLFKEHIKIKKIASSTQNKLSITNNSPVDMDLTDIDQYDNTNKENNSDNIYEVRTPNNKSKIIKTPEHYSDEIYEKKTEPCSSRTSTSKLKVSESTPKGTKDFSKITTKNITKMLAASLGSSERFSSSDSPSSFGIKNNFESLNNSPKAAQTNLNTNSDESYESCNSVVFIVEAPREKQNTTCNENVTLRKKSISKDHFSNVEITDDESTEITNDNIQPPTVTISDSKEEIVVEKKKLTADKIHAESSENTSENFQSSPETEEESESFQSSQETISYSEVDIVVGKKKLTADKIHNESSENTSENFQSSPETISDGEVEIIVGKKKLTEDKIHAESSESTSENFETSPETISDDEVGKKKFTADKIHSELSETTSENVQSSPEIISDGEEEIVVGKKKLTAATIHAESSKTGSKNVQSSPEVISDSEEIVVGKKKLTAATIHAESSKTGSKNVQSSPEVISDSEEIVVGKKKLTAATIHAESSKTGSKNVQSSPEVISDGEEEIVVGKKKLTAATIHAESSKTGSKNVQSSPEVISDSEEIVVGKKKLTAATIHAESSKTGSKNVQSSPEVISDSEEIVVGKKKLTAATIHAESSKTASKNVQSSPEVISDSEEIVVGKKKLTAATIHAESSKTTGGNVQSSPETISDSEEEDILVNFEKNSVVKLYRLDHNIIDQNRNTQDNATNRSLVNENKKRNTLKNKRNTIGPSTSSSNSTVENRRQTRRSSLLNGDQKRVLGSDSTSDEGDKSENRKRLRKLYTPSNYLNLIPPANDEKERQEKRDAAKKINEGYSSNKKTEITRSMVKAAIESAKKMQKECDNKSDSESDTDDDTVLKIPKTQIRELNSNSDTVDGDEDKDGGSKKKTVTETTTRTQDKDDNNNKKGGHTVTKPTNNKRRTAKKRANKKKSSDETDDEQDSSQKVRKTRASTRLSKKPCSTQRRQSLRLQQGPSQSCYRRSTLEFTPISNKNRLKLKPLEKPTVGSTKLHRTDIYVFGRIVNILGRFDYERKVTERTTHLVAGQPRRTMNMLKAIVLGCWIVRKTWMYDSMERGRWVPEEDYELTDFCPAVQANRLQRQAFGASFCVDLFENYGPMYISQSSVPETSDLRFLIEHCKGKITYVPRSASIIIGEYVDCMGVYCVKEQWVLDCITLNQKLPFESYFYR